MRNITKLALVFCFLFFAATYGQDNKTMWNFQDSDKAQESLRESGFIRCSSEEYNAALRQKYNLGTQADFEAWLAPKIEEYNRQRAMNPGRRVVITIPTVVHVIHNGDPINTDGSDNENISDAQVESQIQILNEDFRKLMGTPGDGAGVDTELQFQLAVIDPDGNPTNGIDRVNLGQPSWATGDINTMVKAPTIWPRNDYMNMWSIRFTDTTLLGYAQFPSASTLGGLNASGGLPEHDGVVAVFTTFGAQRLDDGTFRLNAPYNEGRTMTHEIGHFFGLRHIWGDNSSCAGGSTAGDYCADTPDATGSNFGCPTVDSCPSDGLGNDQVENYMDYTDDTCMSIFTQDQKGRIMTVMANSPGRADLINSPALSFDFVMSFAAPSLDVCDSDNAVYTFDYVANAGFTDTVTFSGSDPSGSASFSFSPATANADTTVTVTVSGTGALPVGLNTLTITGTYGSTIKNKEIELNKFSSTFAASNLTMPADGAIDLIDHSFEWDADSNATSYLIEIASDSGFASIVDSATVTTNAYRSSMLSTLTEYFWRVSPINGCGTGTASTAYRFTTANIACLNETSTDTPIALVDATGGFFTPVTPGVTEAKLNLISPLVEITDVNVTLDITHTWDDDLEIVLVSPSGTEVVLTAGNGGSGDNYTNTVFDDQATTGIAAGSPPFTGDFQPMEPLSAFNGALSYGEWTLRITDGAGGDSGNLESWTLEVCGTPLPDADMDGITDAEDNCPDTPNNDQADLDGDGLGDVCDDDIDGDGVLNTDDNCNYTFNPSQVDTDGDGVGDSCQIYCDDATSTSVPVAIPDNDPLGVIIPVEVVEDLLVTEVKVSLDITHTWDGDLTIALISPSGTQVVLTDGNGGSGDDYTNTVFDDQATTDITTASPPFTGSFKPETPLATFVGEESLGNWLVFIIDGAGGDTGDLNSLTVTVCGTSRLVDEDGDGLYDFEDNCPYNANPDQADIDGDGIGDVCDDDMDGDGTLNDMDNCPITYNPDQADSDGDGIGNACGLNVASGFSPNGDGANDVWEIDNVQNFPNNHVQVFNRWGSKVFEANGYMNNWDGVSSEGSSTNKLPTGAYMYVVDPGTGGASLKGWIYINY